MKFNFNSYKFDEVIVSKKELLGMSNEEKETLALEFYNSLDIFIFAEEEEINNKIISNILKQTNRAYINGEFNNSFQLSEGVNYLKSYFKSFYKSYNKGGKSVYDKIINKERLLEVIRYRIGLNNTGEIWDLSFKAIVRGYSAIRGLVSFFKPVVAYSIYDNLLNKPNVVLDPCCGFGGRMLGYFLLNPKGKYIGCEPNVETYNELIRLKNDLSRHFKFEINAVIFNKTIEEFVEEDYDKFEINCAFTSIPYYDLEIYSNNIVTNNYKDFNDWKSRFIGALKKIKNCYINLPIELYEKLELTSIETTYLTNNVSKHFNKTSDVKKELIVKIS